jgi:hypothetical protein
VCKGIDQRKNRVDERCYALDVLENAVAERPTRRRPAQKPDQRLCCGVDQRENLVDERCYAPDRVNRVDVA